MSFDLSFLWFGENRNPSEPDVMRVLDRQGRASPEEQARIRDLAMALVANYPGATWSESPDGLAGGAWVADGPLPDIDLRPDCAFMSSRPDPGDPEELRFYVNLLEFFESRGYLCFDHQRGAIVRASEFSFG